MAYKDDIGKLILRVTLSVMMLFHGVAKIGHLEGVMRVMGKNGLPEFFAYSIYLGEIIAPLMLLIGYRVKISAFIISMTVLAATLMVNANKFFTIGNHGNYALELQTFYIFIGLAIVFLGKDRFCIDSIKKR